MSVGAAIRVHGSLLRRPSAGGRHGDLDLAALVDLKTVHQLDGSD